MDRHIEDAFFHLVEAATTEFDIVYECLPKIPTVKCTAQASDEIPLTDLMDLLAEESPDKNEHSTSDTAHQRACSLASAGWTE